MNDEYDMLDYYSKDCEMYKEGYQDGVKAAFKKLRFYIDIYKDREQSYQPSRTIPEFNKGEGVIYGFNEVLAVMNEIEEELKYEYTYCKCSI